tara:strand:+ start:426 stop:617 length:192 start_codon:yes stop_codon:yes gene_type:complete
MSLDGLKALPKNWADSLEFSAPKESDEDAFALFSQEKKSELAKVESFIMIVKDWVAELVEDTE